MTAWESILSHVGRRIGDAAGVAVDPSDLVAPPDSKLGDLAFGCFKIAKERKKSPAEIASSLASKIVGDHLIEKAVAAGPYLNVTLKAGEIVARIVSDVEAQKAEYGMSDDGKGKLLMLEYAQPNTHKEFHVGHLRNLLLGNALARILKHNGWKVVTASYHGDVGAHVAKCLWLFVKKFQKKEGDLDETTAKKLLASVRKEERTGKYLGTLYAEATALLDEHPEWKDEVSNVQRKLEAHDAAWALIWQGTRRWSIAEFERIFEDIGTSIDRPYFESEVVDEGQRLVDDLLKKKIAQESQGAIIVDLDSDSSTAIGTKLGAFLIRKSDGTSLYATKDLALAFLKAKEYPGLVCSLILVDNRQSLYFQQLFRTLALMGSKIVNEFVGYEFVTLTSGAMSSREGNIVTYESFRDEVVKFARAETMARHDGWNEGKVAHTAWAIAMAGIKYGMLKPDSDTLIVFDLERALAFEGDTGPYIQYAATRLDAILKKAKWDAKKGMKQGDLTLLAEPAEKRLALRMAKLPAVCRHASQELKPNLLAQWCCAMAHAVADFYHDVKVLEAAPEVKAARLRLVASARSALALGLDLLGIPLPDEM